MSNEKNTEKDDKNMADRPGGDVESVLKQLMGIDSMFQAFVDAETEGMIICELLR